MAESYSIMWTDRISFFVDGLLGCFHLSAPESLLLRMCVHVDEIHYPLKIKADPVQGLEMDPPPRDGMGLRMRHDLRAAHAQPQLRCVQDTQE